MDTISNFEMPFNALVLALSKILPMLLVGAVFLWLLVRLLSGSRHADPDAAQDRRALIGHGLIFGVLGSVVGVLFALSKADGLVVFLPHGVIMSTILFQLLGRLRPDWRPPLDSLPAIVGATTGGFCFLFSIFYLGELGFSSSWFLGPGR